MTRTTKTGYGTDRVVDGRNMPYRTATHGGRATVERRDVPSPFDNFIPPFPHPWPFDPSEPRPRTPTWQLRLRKVARLFGVL